MSKVLGKYAQLYLAHHNIYLKSFEMTQNLETKIVDASVYAQDFDESEVLQARGTFELTARLENAYRGSGDADAAYAGTPVVDGVHTAAVTEISYTCAGDPILAGDIISVDGIEKMLVTEVDTTNNILNVRRGYSDTTPVAYSGSETIELSGDRLIDQLLFEETMAPSGVISNTPIPMSFITKKTPVVGGAALMFQGLPALTFSSPVADLASMRCAVQEVGAIHRGTILAIGEYTVAEGTPDYGEGSDNGLQLGRAWKGARFVYHVYSYEVVSGSPTLSIVIERDEAENMPSKADYATLEAGLADVKGEWNEYTDTHTDDWWRARLEIAGSGSATFGIVVIGYVE